MAETQIKYDLHIHSCLSPCGDDSMTPATIAGLGKLAGLDLIALTDHNCAANCPAFMRAAEFYEIAALCGMELTTAEDIHVVCLFDDLKNALAFSEYVENHHQKIKNKPEIFGNQLIMDETDQICGSIEHLLITASDIGFNEVHSLAESFGGAAVPAHIDKDSDSMFGILGAYPPESGFKTFEIFKGGKAASDTNLQKSLISDADFSPRFIIDSDAHMIEDIATAGGEIVIDVTDNQIAKSMLKWLRNNDT